MMNIGLIRLITGLNLFLTFSGRLQVCSICLQGFGTPHSNLQLFRLHCYKYYWITTILTDITAEIISDMLLIFLSLIILYCSSYC